MFALLEHDPPAGAGDRHWDFLVEVAGQERLPTWRLHACPLDVGGPVPAARVPDHRAFYLTYEGPVSGNRGVVRRLDGGPARVQSWDGARLTVELAGARLGGVFTVEPRGDAFCFTRVSA
jgi:hypothetical protein